MRPDLAWREQTVGVRAGEAEGSEGKQKGLLGLPFMRRAAQRQREEAQEAIREMARELEAQEAGSEGEDSAGDDVAPASRLSFRGTLAARSLQVSCPLGWRS